MKKRNLDEKKPCYRVLLHQIERSLIIVDQCYQLDNTSNEEDTRLTKKSYAFALSGFCHVLQESLLTKDEKDEVREKLKNLLSKAKSDSLEYVAIEQLLNEVCS